MKYRSSLTFVTLDLLLHELLQFAEIEFSALFSVKILIWKYISLWICLDAMQIKFNFFTLVYIYTSNCPLLKYSFPHFPDIVWWDLPNVTFHSGVWPITVISSIDQTFHFTCYRIWPYNRLWPFYKCTKFREVSIWYSQRERHANIGRLLLWTSVLSHLVLAYVLMLKPASSSCFRTLNSEYSSILLYFFNAFDTVVVVLCFLFLFFPSQFFNVTAIKVWTFFMQFLCNFVR